MPQSLSRCVLGLTVLVLLTRGSATAQERMFPEKPSLFKPAAMFGDKPLVFSDDFQSGSDKNWEFAMPKAWKIDTQGSTNKVLNQHTSMSWKTPFRSPFNRSLVKEIVVTDFVLDAQVQSTCRDYGHRDVCLFFGFQGPASHYYVHLGKKADDHANQIFIVDGADRKKISTETTAGTDWDDKWHHVRVARSVKEGTIEVFFDNMEKPVMRAKDTTFSWGQVGVGTFDDTAHFDDVVLYGTKVERPNN